jgi:hypothetical protein
VERSLLSDSCCYSDSPLERVDVASESLDDERASVSL